MIANGTTPKLLENSKLLKNLCDLNRGLPWEHRQLQCVCLEPRAAERGDRLSTVRTQLCPCTETCADGRVSHHNLVMGDL